MRESAVPLQRRRIVRLRLPRAGRMCTDLQRCFGLYSAVRRKLRLFLRLGYQLQRRLRRWLPRNVQVRIGVQRTVRPRLPVRLPGRQHLLRRRRGRQLRKLRSRRQLQYYLPGPLLRIV